jgi:hypothetical protein
MSILVDSSTRLVVQGYCGLKAAASSRFRADLACRALQGAVEEKH